VIKSSDNRKYRFRTFVKLRLKADVLELIANGSSLCSGALFPELLLWSTRYVIPRARAKTPTSNKAFFINGI
jgi:hypothetical protein